MATFITPMGFGAVGDGHTDDRAAVERAFKEAWLSGLSVDDEKHSFGVNGEVRIEGVTAPWLRTLKLRQLSTAVDTHIRTLFIDRCQRVKIDNLVIDRGDLLATGSLTYSAGLWLQYGEEHELNGVEVFGGGMGSGVAIMNARNSRYENLRVHDMQFSDPTAPDDRIMGIVLQANENCELVDPIVRRLSGDAAPLRWTRGIALSQSTGVTITEPLVSDVDEAIDITGDGGNFDCVVDGGTTTDCGTYGVKLANSAVRCKVNNVTARRCGLAGFVISGPSQEGQENKTHDCEFNDCISIDTGSNKIGVGMPAGFRVVAALYEHDYPKGTKFNRCQAVDNQVEPTMEFGFHSESQSPQEFKDCSSRGHKQGEYGGTITAAQWGKVVTPPAAPPVVPPVKSPTKKGGGGGCAVMLMGLAGPAAYVADKLF